MKLLTLLLLLLDISAHSQVSNSISVEGAITKPYIVKFDDFKNFKVQLMDSLVILNHKMKRKSSLKAIKGVLLKDLLEKAEFSVNSPKFLSEFYIVCIADDGYKVVFSWNEIFNSETGNKALVVTEIDGKSSVSQKEGIMLVTPTDKATGVRYVKNFSKILIQKIQ